MRREGSHSNKMLRLIQKESVALKSSIFLITGAVSARLAAIPLHHKTPLSLDQAANWENILSLFPSFFLKETNPSLRFDFYLLVSIGANVCFHSV